MVADLSAGLGTGLQGAYTLQGGRLEVNIQGHIHAESGCDLHRDHIWFTSMQKWLDVAAFSHLESHPCRIWK